MEAWDSVLDEVESEMIDVESVLDDLDDLDALRRRIQAAEASDSIQKSAVLRRCAELLGA